MKHYRRVLQPLQQVYEHASHSRHVTLAHASLRKGLIRRPIARLSSPAAGANIRHSSSTSQEKSSGTDAAKSEGGEAFDIIFAANHPPELPNRIARLEAWTISPARTGIIRHFQFPTFSAAWRFMSIVSDECKAKKHHPSWHNLYNQVTVEWTTHKPKGLSVKDAEMAEFCDRIANEIGLKTNEQSNRVASHCTGNV